jgi:hypothetical protein
MAPRSSAPPAPASDESADVTAKRPDCIDGAARGEFDFAESK